MHKPSGRTGVAVEVATMCDANADEPVPTLKLDTGDEFLAREENFIALEGNAAKIVPILRGLISHLVSGYVALAKASEIPAEVAMPVLVAELRSAIHAVESCMVKG